MSAVLGPFVFTSDVFRDEHVAKAKAAGCRSIALQLGVAPPSAWQFARAEGLQVIGWGSCQGLTPVQVRVDLVQMNPDVWMPQAETTAEFEALIAALPGPPGVPIEPVMTSGGMETEKPNATDAEKVAERTRRRNLLASFGIQTVWVEVYKQDADRSGQRQLGDVNHMCAFFQDAFGFREAHPVIGLWTVDDSQGWADNPYEVRRYDLSRHGFAFGAWRAEQMADERYAEMRACVNSLSSPAPAPPPPPRPAGPTTAQARRLVVDTVRDWRETHGRPEPLARLTIAERACSDEFTAAQWRRMAPVIRGLMNQEHDEP